MSMPELPRVAFSADGEEWVEVGLADDVEVGVDTCTQDVNAEDMYLRPYATSRQYRVTLEVKMTPDEFNRFAHFWMY